MGGVSTVVAGIEDHGAVHGGRSRWHGNLRGHGRRGRYGRGYVLGGGRASGQQRCRREQAGGQERTGTHPDTVPHLVAETPVPATCERQSVVKDKSVAVREVLRCRR